MELESRAWEGIACSHAVLPSVSSRALLTSLPSWRSIHNTYYIYQQKYTYSKYLMLAFSPWVLTHTPHGGDGTCIHHM